MEDKNKIMEVDFLHGERERERELMGKKKRLKVIFFFFFFLDLNKFRLLTCG
jgi:hypothetical protein